METGKMKVGNLIQCLETQRIGMILEMHRTDVAVMALVRWPEGSDKWVDAVEFEVLDS